MIAYLLYNRNRESQYYKFFGETWVRKGELMVRVTPFEHGTEGRTLGSQWRFAEDVMVYKVREAP